jgi:NitT/TauT family transport system substrate-binding protein
MMSAGKKFRPINILLMLAFCFLLLNLIADSAFAAEMKNVKFGWIAATGVPTLFIAQDKGFFAEEGIECKIETITAGSSMVVEVVASGQLDMGQTGSSTIMLAIEKGVPIRLIGTFEYQFIDKKGRAWDTVALVCKAEDDYKKLGDLKGKKIAVNDFGSMYNYYLRYQLRKHGINPDRDVMIISIPFSHMLGAIIKKQVDAAVMLTYTHKEIPLKVIMEGTKLQDMDIDGTAVIGVNEKFAKTHPDLVVKFLKAAIKSSNFIAKDIKENNGEFLKSSVQKWLKYKPEFLENWYTHRAYHGEECDFVNPIQVPWSIIPKLSEILVMEKFLNKPLTPEKVIDNSFIKKAYNELGLKWDDTKGR